MYTCMHTYSYMYTYASLHVHGYTHMKVCIKCQVQHQQLMMMLDNSSSRQATDRGTAPPLNITSSPGSQPVATQQRPTTDSTPAVSVKQIPDVHQANSDSLPLGQTSTSSDLSIRHLHHEDTSLPLPVPPPLMTTPLPLLHLPSHHTVTQPHAYLSPAHCVAKSGEEKYGYTNNFPLLQLDAPEDAMTWQYDGTFTGRKGVTCEMQPPPPSSHKQSVAAQGSFPLLTLRHTGEEVVMYLFFR